MKPRTVTSKSRKELIRNLYTPGQGGVIARHLGVSRQYVHKVIHASEPSQDGKLRRFRGWLRDSLLRAKRLLRNSREP